MVTTLTQDSIDQFLRFMSVNGHSENTIRAYRADLKDLLGTAGGPISVVLLEEAAAQWLTAGRKRWAPKTTCRKATAVRSWAKWAGLRDCLGAYRLPDPGRAEPHPMPEGMGGVARMLSACGRNAQKRALVSLVCQCGLRISEAIAVTPDSFDLIERTVTVHGKGDKRLVRPVSPACWPNLVDAIAGARYGPPGTRVIPWGNRHARRVFSDLGLVAGLSRPVSSHDGRATFATHAYEVTKDLRVVQELLGHSNSKTTEVYTKVTMDGMRAAVAAAIV